MACVLLIALFFVNVAAQNFTLEQQQPQNGTCRWGPDTFQHGSQIDQSTFWFLCLDGNIVPMGCFTDEGRRINFGDSYRTANGYEMTCERLNATYRMQPSACIHNGERYTPGESFQDDFFWYTCIMHGDAIKKDPSGCMDKQQQRVNPGQMVTQGNYLFLCNLDVSGNYYLLPLACLKDDQHYDIGQRMVDGMYWYTCEKSPQNHISFHLNGCVYGDKFLNVSDKYYHNGFVFQCQRQPGNSLSHTIVGCLETDANGKPQFEHAFGDKWATGTAPFMFMVECKPGQGGGASQTLTECLYKGPEGDAVLQPNCMRKVGVSGLVLCLKREDGGISMDRMSIERINEAVQKGLHEC